MQKKEKTEKRKPNRLILKQLEIEPTKYGLLPLAQAIKEVMILQRNGGNAADSLFHNFADNLLDELRGMIFSYQTRAAVSGNTFSKRRIGEEYADTN